MRIKIFIVLFALILSVNVFSQNEYVFFNGNNYVDLGDNLIYSPAATNSFTVSVWVRPSTLNFRYTEGDGYVHWLGKGSSGECEWAFRMYNKDSARPNRISFYLFNKEGGFGTGSYFEEYVELWKWMHIAATYDGKYIKIYKNGILKDMDLSEVKLEKGTAPLMVGTRNKKSYFEGNIDDLKIFNNAMPQEQISIIYKEGLRKHKN